MWPSVPPRAEPYSTTQRGCVHVRLQEVLLRVQRQRRLKIFLCRSYSWPFPGTFSLAAAQNVSVREASWCSGDIQRLLLHSTTKLYFSFQARGKEEIQEVRETQLGRWKLCPTNNIPSPLDLAWRFFSPSAPSLPCPQPSPLPFSSFF